MKQAFVVLLAILAAVACLLAPMVLGLVIGFIMPSGKKLPTRTVELIYVKTVSSSGQPTAQPPARDATP